MSLTKPSRLFINNLKRGLEDFPDQFSVQLPAPVQGLTRLTLESAIVEYNPLHPTFPPYTNMLDASCADVGLVQIEIPTEVDWNTYVVNTETSWPKNFQEYINDALVSAGSSTSVNIELGDDAGLPGFLEFTSVSGTGTIQFLGQSSLANTENSIMERIGLSYRLAALGVIPELTLAGGRAVFTPTITGTICPGNFILGRTGSVYILCDLDNGGQSDANIQNILSVIPLSSATSLGDNIIGEDTNSLTTAVNPSSDFNRVRILLFDDNYQPFELREEARVIMEFHLAYDRPDAVILA